MNRLGVISALAMAAALSGCGERREPLAPEGNRGKWGWNRPLATGNPPIISVDCSPQTVSFGDTVTCTASGLPPGALPVWTYEGPHSNGQMATNTASWAGPVIETGGVSVEFTIDGQRESLPAGWTVTRRSWSWASSVGGSQATSTEIDGCMSAGWYGLTASVHCTSTTNSMLFHPIPANLSSGTGYTATSVPGSGPNGGLWYVASTSADMDLRSQVHPWYRSNSPNTFTMLGAAQAVSDGCATAFPIDPGGARSLYTVNTVCTTNYASAYSSLLNCASSHEGQHLSSATTSAQSADNDVYKLWEPLVATTAGDLQTAVSIAYTNANTRVFSAADNAHNAMTPHQFTIWDFLPPWGTTVKNDLIC
jgi:hypothetical protein